MTNDDLPALYRSADALAANQQRWFYRALFSYLTLLIIGAALSAAPSSWGVAIFQAGVFVCTVGLCIYLYVLRPDQLWYSSRAIAESMKTLSWRYACRAEPFDGEDEAAAARLRERLKDVVWQNPGIAGRFEDLAGAQISVGMQALRASTLQQRIQVYRDARIRNQLSWYQRKSKVNRRYSRGLFLGLILVNLIALAFALFRIRFPEAKFWPTDIVIAVAASLITWLQAKRYSELASSYALAASDISLVREQLDSVANERDFSKYVGDAENAFSREHTQWSARKDS